MENSKTETKVETGLAAAKNVHDTYSFFKKGYDAVVAVTTANPVSLVFRGLLLLFMAIGFAFLKKYIKDVKREQAKVLTAKQKEELQDYIISLEKTTSDDAFDIEDDL